MSVQVYAHFDDRGSFANVSRALVRALRRRGLQGSVFAVHSLQPRYEDVSWPVGLDSRAAVGICVDYPLVAGGYLEGHPHRILVTVCESNKVPGSWVDACNQMDLVVVPSAFCQLAFKTSGVKTPILVAHHGVDEGVPFVTPAGEATGPIRLLHVSGAASFPKRKGTAALLAAFARVAHSVRSDTRPVKLYLRMFDNPGLRDAIASLGLENFVELDKVPCPDSLSMARHLCTFDAVVQPSRGEGFGMVPLEARCVGVPVVMTADTGHLAHYAPGVDIRIKTGGMEPLTTQGNDHGSAPSVSIAAVEEALNDLITDLPKWKERAMEWARKNAKEWTWPKALAPLTRHVVTYGQEQGPRKLGQESGLRGY